MKLSNLTTAEKFMVAFATYYFEKYMATREIWYLDQYADIKYRLQKRGIDCLPLDLKGKI